MIAGNESFCYKIWAVTDPLDRSSLDTCRSRNE